MQKRIPADLVGRFAALGPESEAVWAEAKDNDDYASFKPYLEQVLALNIELAEAIGYDDHPFDALVHQFELGLTAAKLKRIFGRSQSRLAAASGANRRQ